MTGTRHHPILGRSFHEHIEPVVFADVEPIYVARLHTGQVLVAQGDTDTGCCLVFTTIEEARAYTRIVFSSTSDEETYSIHVEGLLTHHIDSVGLQFISYVDGKAIELGAYEFAFESLAAAINRLIDRVIKSSTAEGHNDDHNDAPECS